MTKIQDQSEFLLEKNEKITETETTFADIYDINNSDKKLSLMAKKGSTIENELMTSQQKN